MTATRRRTFPLVPRRPLAGTVFGTQRSLRRGPGSDIAGTRPYRPGDRLSSIDWFASARLSAASGGDEFVVRQTYAEDAPRIVVVLDRRPSMALYDDALPFLSKPRAVREIVAAVVSSARAARAEIGWLEAPADGITWLPPRNTLPAPFVERRLAAPADGGDDSLARAVDHLTRHPTEAPQGTFVFVVSDFLAPPPPSVWRAMVGRGVDVVPVAVRDPVWETSFPDVAGVLLPFAGPDGRDGGGVRLSRGEVADRRAANERRAARLAEDLRRAGLDLVAVDSADPVAVDAAFAAWAARRRLLRRRGGR
ncbi:MAG TPA: DUF58 domain-containing protein [Gaiellaceae bacterium]|nr:DUF58 domain-containing protein [Gaiellaceae bacterium]